MDKIEKIRAEIERLIGINKTKNGFPAGTLCAVRIEAYEKLLSFLDTLGEEPDRDLEEAARQYGYTCSADWPGQVPAARDGFIAGAEWKENQLMKEAVDGTVHHYAALVHYVNTDEVQLTERLKQFQDGDKVKVIVIKED